MELAQKLLSALFPSRCILCRQTVRIAAINPNIEVCRDCYKILPHNDNNCVRCALPLPVDIGSQILCGRCIKKTPSYDYSCSVFRYESDIINLIHQLKFGEKISYARSIGEILLASFESDLLEKHGAPDCIIPVPIHDRRLRGRGYNQSIEIARVMAKKLAIPIAYDAVVKKHSTLAQSGLNAKERQKNIKNAFDVINVENYKHVLIVDDVVTTGSTVNEIAKALKKNGVDRVGVLSIARAPVKN
ncbi:MAG: ComF family protein [Gammaproteobacteria bacterium]|nr:ComF family protein [Gammaproteobacteria bacterium]